MEYDSALSLLSSKFTQDYPLSAYPELMYKSGRPYTCLLIESHADYFICVPFRSYIRHKNAYLFTNSSRSQKTKSGLDYSKIVLIKDSDYLDSTTTAIVDQDEYTEMIKNLPTIVHDASNYVTTYTPKNFPENINTQPFPIFMIFWESEFLRLLEVLRNYI